MITYEVRREGSEHTITVGSIDPDGAAVSLELAADIAATLSRKQNCVLTVHRVDDMAWNVQDYSLLVAAYDRGMAVTWSRLHGQNRHLPYISAEQDAKTLRKHTQEDENTP